MGLSLAFLSIWLIKQIIWHDDEAGGKLQLQYSWGDHHTSALVPIFTPKPDDMTHISPVTFSFKANSF